MTPAKTGGRRVGRRGLAAFFGFVGVFLLADGSLETRDAIDLQEKRIAAKQRATEAHLQEHMAPEVVAGLSKRSAREQAKLEALEQRLYGMLGAAAVALLAALVLALSDTEPRWLALGLAILGAALWIALGVMGPVLPFFVAAFVAHVPDEVWDPRENHDG